MKSIPSVPPTKRTAVLFGDGIDRETIAAKFPHIMRPPGAGLVDDRAAFFSGLYQVVKRPSLPSADRDRETFRLTVIIQNLDSQTML
jgi:hypothetical protein